MEMRKKYVRFEEIKVLKLTTERNDNPNLWY